jgi:hypothetical protein
LLGKPADVLKWIRANRGAGLPAESDNSKS